MARLQGIIFDLDGTLIDSALTIREVINAIRHERSGSPATVEDIRPHLSKGGLALVRASLGRVADDGEADLALFRKRYATVRQGPEILFRHVREALENIHALGLPMAVCTNKPKVLAYNALEHTGLASVFDVVVAGEPSMPSKPNPASLFEACRQLGVAPERSLLVGDSEADADAAQAAGMPFVFVTYGYPVGDPAAIPRRHAIDCASELPAIVRDAIAGAHDGEFA